MIVRCVLRGYRSEPSAEVVDYPVKVGVEYYVFCIIFIENKVEFLVCDENRHPTWVPSSLFEVIDSKVPSEWRFCIAEQSEEFKSIYRLFGVTGLLGYEKMVTSYRHYAGVIERDSNELDVFFRENFSVLADELHFSE